MTSYSDINSCNIVYQVICDSLLIHKTLLFEASVYLGGSAGRPVGKYAVNMIQSKQNNAFAEHNLSYRNTDNEVQKCCKIILKIKKRKEKRKTKHLHTKVSSFKIPFFVNVCIGFRVQINYYIIIMLCFVKLRSQYVF